MRKFFKWVGIVILSLVIIIVVVILLLSNKATKAGNKTYEVSVPTIEIPTDSASFVRGSVIATSICGHCHGGDFGGTPFFNEPDLAEVPAPNITKGGVTKDYSDADWIRVIRYGVKPDKTGVFIMPSLEMGKMSDKDLGALISYLKTVAASDKTWPDPKMKLLGKVMAGAGLFGELYQANLIDLTNTKPIIAPEPGPTVEYGAYTLSFHGCDACHGAGLNGYQSDRPGAPAAANLTPGGNLGKWSLDQFKETLRSGNTPEGKKLNDEFMPWAAAGLMTDMELEAIYNYLKRLPAREDDPGLKKYKEKLAK
ncbi:MAG: c-type cytochrome [Chitinophagales bacterium]